MVCPTLAWFIARINPCTSETKIVSSSAFGNAGAMGNHFCTGGLIISSLLFLVSELPAAEPKEDASKIINILYVMVFISNTNDHTAETGRFVKPICYLLIEECLPNKTKNLLKFTA